VGPLTILPQAPTPNPLSFRGLGGESEGRVGDSLVPQPSPQIFLIIPQMACGQEEIEGQG
jgi:hypothetical protein